MGNYSIVYLLDMMDGRSVKVFIPPGHLEVEKSLIKARTSRVVALTQLAPPMECRLTCFIYYSGMNLSLAAFQWPLKFYTS